MSRHWGQSFMAKSPEQAHPLTGFFNMRFGLRAARLAQMDMGMFGLRHQFEVFQAVVGWIAVDMVNLFVLFQETTKRRLHYEAVFKDISMMGVRVLRCAYPYIPKLIRKPSAFPEWVPFGLQVLIAWGQFVSFTMSPNAGQRITCKMAVFSGCALSNRCLLTTTTFTQTGRNIITRLRFVRLLFRRSVSMPKLSGGFLDAFKCFAAATGA